MNLAEYPLEEYWHQSSITPSNLLRSTSDAFSSVWPVGIL